MIFDYAIVRAGSAGCVKIGDGSALAFFQFINPEKQEQFDPMMAPTLFHHIALKCEGETQNQVKERLAVVDYHELQTFVFEHGYNGCSIRSRNARHGCRRRLCERRPPRRLEPFTGS